MNNLGQEIVEGGPFTRKDPATGNLSCLDLFIASRELLPYVKKLFIDSRREMAVSRAVRKGNNYKLVYSDHFTCWLTLEKLPRKRQEEEKKTVLWNLSKEGGWTKYKELTDKYSEALERAIEEGDTIEAKMKQFEKIHDRIKFKAFGKATVKNNHKRQFEVDKDTTDDHKAKQIFEGQVKKVNDEIEHIKKTKAGKVGMIWDIRKRVVGGRKNHIKATAIVDPKDGKLIVSRAEVKNVTLKYCKETLANNKPTKDFEEFILSKQKKVAYKMQEKQGNFRTEQRVAGNKTVTCKDS